MIKMLITGCTVLLFTTAAYTEDTYSPLVPNDSKYACNSFGILTVANFESSLYKNVTMFGTYGFMYADASTEIIAGAVWQADTMFWNIIFSLGTGSDSVGYSASLDARFGDANQLGTTQESRFAGVAFSMYDSVTSTYFDATTGKRGTTGPGGIADGILFDYRTDGEIEGVKLEVLDSNDVGDATAPLRRFKRGEGNVYHRHLLPTNGTWMSTKVMFSALEIDSTQPGFTVIPINEKRIARFNFRIEGAAGRVGTLAVDNILLPSADDCNPLQIRAVPQQTHRQKTFHVINNQILFPREMLSGSQHVAIELIGVTGKVAASQRFCTHGSPIVFSTAHVPPGVYLLTIRGLTSERGKKSVFQEKITIVR